MLFENATVNTIFQSLFVNSIFIIALQRFNQKGHFGRLQNYDLRTLAVHQPFTSVVPASPVFNYGSIGLDVCAHRAGCTREVRASVCVFVVKWMDACAVVRWVSVCIYVMCAPFNTHIIMMKMYRNFSACIVDVYVFNVIIVRIGFNKHTRAARVMESPVGWMAMQSALCVEPFDRAEPV